MQDQSSVLIVDDDHGFVQVAAAILRGKDYVVQTASSGTEAACQATKNFYNIAILDISLPDVDGTELLSALVKAQPDTVAIMLTGHSSVHNAVRSLNYGASAYLEKPVDPEHLLSVISRGLEKQRLVFENRRLVAELEKRNHDIENLLTVSQTVSRSLDFQTIVDSALSEVARIMSVDACCLYLREEKKLTLKGCHGLGEPDRQKMAGAILDEGIIGQAIGAGRPFVAVVGANRPQKSIPGPSTCEPQFVTNVYAPLATAEGNMGVMALHSRSDRGLSKSEIEFVEAMAREVAVAIRNSQLYEEASSARALRELDNFRSQLLANVAHELRTPLTPIKGFAGALLLPGTALTDDSRREYLKIIEREADNLNDLIEELLVGSRIEAGTWELKREICRVDNIIESVAPRLNNLAAKHKLQVIIPEGLPLVEVDSTHIGRVVTNLVDNASKYSAEGTRITIEAMRNDGHVVIQVTDEGIGIPRDYHEKVFERFFRVETPLATRKKGTGLGLNICRSIVREHGGEIWVESEYGKGSTFSFTLPAKN